MKMNEAGRQKCVDLWKTRSNAQRHGSGSTCPKFCVKRGFQVCGHAESNRRGQTEAHHRVSHSVELKMHQEWEASPSELGNLRTVKATG